MRRLVIPLAGCMALAGCMVGPDYVRPKVDTPDAFRYEETFARDTVNTEWWKAFRDPVLDGLVAEALAANRNVKIAAANIDQAVGVLTQTRSPLFPQVNYGGSAGRMRNSEAMIPECDDNDRDDDDRDHDGRGHDRDRHDRHRRDRNCRDRDRDDRDHRHHWPPRPPRPPRPIIIDIDIDIVTPQPPNPTNVLTLFTGASWEVDLWGRVRRLSESARANLLASEEARRGVILSLVSSVAGQYLQLRGLDEQLLIAKRNRDSYAESVRIFELQLQYGLISRLVVEQARTQYETAAATVPQIESQIAQLENFLSVLLGRNPGPITRGKSIHELELPSVPAGLPSQLLERRPDVAQAEQNLIAANALIGAAKARYFPAISLTGSYGVQSAELNRLFTGPAQTWNYSASVTGPIFTAGAISGQVEEAKAGREAALQNYQDVIQNAFADVENALVIRRSTSEQLLAQERLVTASREYEHLAKLQYDEGYAPYLTVLNAQEQLFPGELTLAQLRASLLAAYVNLYKAMGGGWIDKAAGMTVKAGEPGKTQRAEQNQELPPYRQTYTERTR